jgi:hypothetical protein
MAYAYARRAAAAGLCAQGIWGQDGFDQSLTMFHALQQSTEHTVEFQKKAAEQSIELFQSYDSRLNKEFVYPLTQLMMSHASRAKDSGKYFSVEELMEILSKS